MEKRMRSMDQVWAVLLLCAVSMACSSSAADVSCDGDGDCFSGEVCHSSVCVPADQVDADVGIEEGADSDSNQENGGGENNEDAGENNEDAGGSVNSANGGSTEDAEGNGSGDGGQGGNSEEHQCTGSSIHCDRPDHLGFNDSYSIVAGEVTGVLNEAGGCGPGIDELQAFEEVTDVFSLCAGDSHYYNDRFWQCPEDYWIVATIEPEALCPVEIAELDVSVMNFEGNCENPYVECTTESDGTREVLVRMRHDAYHNDAYLRLRLDDVADYDIEFDYRVRLRTTTSLD